MSPTTRVRLKAGMKWHVNPDKTKVQVPKTCAIGRNCRIGVGAKIEEEVTLCNNVTIEEEVTLCWGVTINSYTVVRRGATIRKDAFVSSGVEIGRDAVVNEAVTIGSDAVVGRNSQVICDVPNYDTVRQHVLRVELVPQGHQGIWGIDAKEKLV